ncbi:AraC family transcriptional regulator [Wenyingzhuangia sp. IMCC45533]
MKIIKVSKTKIPCIQHKGIVGVEKSFDQIIAWGAQKKLIEEQNTKLLRIYHDSFTNTHQDQIRMSICLHTSENFQQDSLISSIIIPQHKAITSRFEIAIDEFQNSWTSMYQWMKENYHIPSNASPYEVYHNDYRLHPDNKCIVDLHIPIL